MLLSRCVCSRTLPRPVDRERIPYIVHVMEKILEGGEWLTRVFDAPIPLQIESERVDQSWAKAKSLDRKLKSRDWSAECIYISESMR